MSLASTAPIVGAGVASVATAGTSIAVGAVATVGAANRYGMSIKQVVVQN